MMTPQITWALNMIRPVIGITSDCDGSSEDIESQYFVRRNYCAAVAKAGGIPVVLPYDVAAAEDHIDLLDGLLITGGMFDVSPEEYGMHARYPEKIILKSDRTRFERGLLRIALKRDLPVLGICGGMQLIAVEMGAKLHQHIPSDLSSNLEHKQAVPCNLATHCIDVVENSLLHTLVGTEKLHVNSLHHQAVAGGNHRLRVSALAEDGVVESVEVPDQTFCLGVQWHPEYLVNDGERHLFEEFVRRSASCTQRRRIQ